MPKKKTCVPTAEPQHSVVSESGWMTEKSWFDFRHGQKVCLLSRVSRPTLEPTQILFIYFIPMALSPGINQLSHEYVDSQSLPAEGIINRSLYSTPHTFPG